MKKKLLKILFYLLVVVVTVIYTYKIRIVVDDEIFNYGFAKNILDGLIPYKDFNMIIPPLFAYITALVLKMFGESLLVYHIFTALIIFGISYMSSKKIGKSAISIYLFLLIYPYTGYNMFSLFLFFILLSLKEDDERNYYLEPIIISLMILTKHTLGLLVIPSILYSKKKLKTFSIYVISFLFLLLYLIMNNNLLQFIDYCILGMFNFTSKNGTTFNFLVVVEVMIIVLLIYKLIKTKRKDYFYILMYQIVTFPIVNYIHFMISFIPVVYLVLYENKKNFLVNWFSGVIAVSFFLCFVGMIVNEYSKVELQTYERDNFMKGRLIYGAMISYVDITERYIEKYEDYTPFLLTNVAYQIKLDLDYEINKFDLINNGNMGYKGGDGYIKEIDEYCKENKCLFFINEIEVNNKKGNQTNQDILKYVEEEYTKVYSSNTINIYKN